MSESQIRSKVVCETADFRASIALYPRRHRQPPHRHDSGQISFLLAGSVLETVDGHDSDAATRLRCLKPDKTVHSNLFGPNGALMLCFQIRAGESAERLFSGRVWNWSALSRHQMMAAVDFSSAQEIGDRTDWLWDQLACDIDEPAASPPPAWLRRTRDRLEADPGSVRIAELARDAGVHRVHLSRLFSRHYGASPSTFRQRQMAMVALDSMIRKRLPAASAAHAAGFADQSHMMRTVRRVAGFSPGQIGRALS